MQLQKTRIRNGALIGALSTALLLVITGCGGAGQLPSANSLTATADSTPSATPTPTPTPSPNPTSTPTPTPTPTPARSPNGIPRSSHVVLIIEENHMFTEVYPDGMPWLVSQGNKFGYATNYKANSVGSAMDYLWLSSGSAESDFGCTGDGCTKPITDDNIFGELRKAGLTWKVYAQSIPSVGFMGTESGSYVARHNPARWYDAVTNPASPQVQNMVPFTQLAADMASNQLPNYSIIIPDLDNDAHDGTLAQADDFLAKNVAPLLDTKYFQPGGDGLMFVTFDECDAAVGNCSGQVYTAVIGPNVKHGFQSATPYQHQNTLRTILEALGIMVFPGASNSAAAMSDFF